MEPAPILQDRRKRLIAFANDWVRQRSRRAAGQSQWNIYVAELSEGALRDVLENGGDERALEYKLIEAHQILSDVKLTLSPTPYDQSDHKRYRDLSEDQFEKLKKRIDAMVWWRQKADNALQEGFDSEGHVQFDKRELWQTIAKYLERPYLRSPSFEWLLVDALVYLELCLFGDAVKQRMPGPIDALGISSGYFKAGGNLDKMLTLRLKWQLGVLGAKAAVFIGLPGLAVWWGMKHGHEVEAIFGGAAYAALLIVWTIWKRIRRLIWAPKKSPFEIGAELWDDMSKVYRLLEPPIVNPTLVKEQLIKTHDKGAVWDTAVYTLVERAIARDPSAWIADPWARADRLIEI